MTKTTAQTDQYLFFGRWLLRSGFFRGRFFRGRLFASGLFR
jgi:hypothetical protein